MSWCVVCWSYVHCAVADLVEEVEEVAEADRFLAKAPKPNCPQFKSCKKCNTVAKSTCHSCASRVTADAGPLLSGDGWCRLVHVLASCCGESLRLSRRVKLMCECAVGAVPMTLLLLCVCAGVCVVQPVCNRCAAGAHSRPPPRPRVTA